MTTEILVQTMVGGLSMGLVYALVAVGVALIWSLMGMVNFAHGEFVMLGMFGSFWAYTILGWDPLVSLVPIAFVMFGVGALTYATLIRRVMHAPVMAQMFATFGLMLLLQNLAQFLWSSDFRLISQPLSDVRLSVFGIFLQSTKVVAGVGGLVGLASLFVFMWRTDWGRALRAAAQDRQAAAVMGIDVERAYVLGWALAAASAAIAGVLLSNFFYISPRVGFNFALIAFVVVALGGFGSITGVLLGALIVGLTESVAALFLPPTLKYAAFYVLFFGVVLIRPTGLLGKF